MRLADSAGAPAVTCRGVSAGVKGGVGGEERRGREGGGCSANLQGFRERKIKRGGWEKNRGRKEAALWRNVSNATLSHNQAHV